MEHFGKKVIQEAVDKYPMPYTLNDVNGKPAIFGIQPQQIKGELLPQVNYISKITVADSVALKKENKEVQKAVGRQFPHFKENNTHILYRAFNDLPSDSKIPESYNFIEDTKQ